MSTSCCCHHHCHRTSRTIISNPERVAASSLVSLSSPLWTVINTCASTGKTHYTSNNIYILTRASLLSCPPFGFHIVYSVRIVCSSVPLTSVLFCQHIKVFPTSRSSDGFHLYFTVLPSTWLTPSHLGSLTSQSLLPSFGRADYKQTYTSPSLPPNPFS